MGFIQFLKTKDFAVDFRHVLFSMLLLIILPNLLLESARHLLHFHRLPFNLDYIPPLLLLVAGGRWLRSLGAILLLLVLIVDLLLVFMEYYPSLRLADFLYLVSLTFNTDKLMILACLGVVVALLAYAWLIIRLCRLAWPVETCLVAFCVVLLQAGVAVARPFDSTFFSNGFSESRAAFLILHKDRNYTEILNADVLSPYHGLHATAPWTEALQQQQPLNRKLLLILVESWGMPNNPAIHDDILRRIYEQRDKLDFFRTGSFPFLGLTSEAELRELCQLHTASLDLLEVKTGFQGCFPHQLLKRGYATYGLHGAGGIVYGRESWYRLAGLQNTRFIEDIDVSSYCIPFDGVCDWDMLKLIENIFARDQAIFVHWLTLTSHFYYARSDIHNTRFDCAKYGMKADEACRNLMHQTQFFDNLVQLLSAPSMKGVEVIAVGDHFPPLFAMEDAIFKRETPQSRTADVPWLHFRIAE